MATKDHRPTSIPTLLPLLLLLLPLLHTAEAQTSQPINGQGFATANINSSTAIVIVVLVSAFFFLAFFAVYIRQCSLGGSSTAGPARVFATGGGRSRRGGQRGLDPEVLETFPTLVYSQVKGLKIGKEALECAVCLSEFSDDETLRLLPRCSHVFHPDCIDVWLASHVTCPVCRTDLTASDTGRPAELASDGDAEEQAPREVEGPLPGHVTIAVGVEEAPGDRGLEAIDLARIASGKREVTRTGPAQFPRSHTTGHSVARPGERSDRYTLRLPEHVRKEILSDRRLRRTASCVVFPGGGEASARRGYRSGGEGSRAGRSVRLGARSDRWAQSFLARALSVRVPAWAVGRRGDGEGSVKKGEVMEGSSRGIFPSARAPFDCLGGGGGGGGGRSADEDESSTAPLARV